MTDTGKADFNLQEDVKPTPLIPPSHYLGSITQAKFNDNYTCLTFNVTLNDNGGFMTDGETNIDGATIPYRVWLPKPGDENVYTSSGRQTKWQWKVNQMAKVFNELGDEEISDISSIEQAINEARYIGRAVKVEITTGTDMNNQAVDEIRSFTAI